MTYRVNSPSDVPYPYCPESEAPYKPRNSPKSIECESLPCDMERVSLLEPGIERLLLQVFSIISVSQNLDFVNVKKPTHV